MSTRRDISRILKQKGINAENIQYDRAGPEEYGWWTVTLSPVDASACRVALNEPDFTGSIEFCEIEDGMEQLSELPVIKEPAND